MAWYNFFYDPIAEATRNAQAVGITTDELLTNAENDDELRAIQAAEHDLFLERKAAIEQDYYGSGQYDLDYDTNFAGDESFANVFAREQAKNIDNFVGGVQSVANTAGRALIGSKAGIAAAALGGLYFFTRR